jgi:hypothetical protein
VEAPLRLGASMTSPGVRQLLPPRRLPAPDQVPRPKRPPAYKAFASVPRCTLALTSKHFCSAQTQADKRTRSPSIPALSRHLIEPKRQVATPLQAGLVLGPVPDRVASLWDAVTAGGIMLERHAQECNGLAAAGAPDPAPCINAPRMETVQPVSRHASIDDALLTIPH